jgi:hypothetical protein
MEDKVALGQVLLLVLRFPLSVSFYQCFVPIYFSATDAM